MVITINCFTMTRKQHHPHRSKGPPHSLSIHEPLPSVSRYQFSLHLRGSVSVGPQTDIEWETSAKINRFHVRIFPVQFAIYFRPTPSFCCGSPSSTTSSFHWPKGFDSPGENPNEPQINRLGGLRIPGKVNYLLLVIPVGSVIRVICLPFAIKSTLQWGRRCLGGHCQSQRAPLVAEGTSVARTNGNWTTSG